MTSEWSNTDALGHDLESGRGRKDAYAVAGRARQEGHGEGLQELLRCHREDMAQ